MRGSHGSHWHVLRTNALTWTSPFIEEIATINVNPGYKEASINKDQMRKSLARKVGQMKDLQDTPGPQNVDLPTWPDMLN